MKNKYEHLSKRATKKLIKLEDDTLGRLIRCEKSEVDNEIVELVFESGSTELTMHLNKASLKELKRFL